MNGNESCRLEADPPGLQIGRIGVRGQHADPATAGSEENPGTAARAHLEKRAVEATDQARKCRQGKVQAELCEGGHKALYRRIRS